MQFPSSDVYIFLLDSSVRYLWKKTFAQLQCCVKWKCIISIVHSTITPYIHNIDYIGEACLPMAEAIGRTVRRPPLMISASTWCSPQILHSSQSLGRPQHSGPIHHSGQQGVRAGQAHLRRQWSEPGDTVLLYHRLSAHRQHLHTAQSNTSVCSFRRHTHRVLQTPADLLCVSGEQCVDKCSDGAIYPACHSLSFYWRPVCQHKYHHKYQDTLKLISQNHTEQGNFDQHEVSCRRIKSRQNNWQRMKTLAALVAHSLYHLPVGWDERERE